MTLLVRLNTDDRLCKYSRAGSGAVLVLVVLPNCEDRRNAVVETALAKSRDEKGPRNLDSIVVRKESNISSCDVLVLLLLLLLAVVADVLLLLLTTMLNQSVYIQFSFDDVAVAYSV